MSTIFPLSASAGQVFDGYTFDGTAWNINGIDLNENYLEESSASAIYLNKVSASTTYLTQSSASTNYVNKVVNGLNLVIPTGATNGTVGANGAITVGSAVSSVTVTGAFSSAYENYKIIYSGGVLVGGQGQLSLQLGSSSASYRGSLMYQQYGSNAVNGATDNGASSFTWVGGGDTNGCWLTCDLLNPNLARYTRIKDGLYSVTDTTGIYSGLHEVATAYTGFTIIVGSGRTMTGGTIRIYGYNNGT